MVRFVLGVLAGVALAGCGDRTQIAVTQICATACDCSTLSPRDYDVCVDECEAEAPDVLPDACIACAAEEACVALETCLESCLEEPVEDS